MRRKIGFTLVELLVVIAIISILAGLLLPVIETAVSQATVVNCVSNLRQVGVGTSMYLDDFDSIPMSTFPISNARWPKLYLHYGSTQYTSMYLMIRHYIGASSAAYGAPADRFGPMTCPGKNVPSSAPAVSWHQFGNISYVSGKLLTSAYVTYNDPVSPFKPRNIPEIQENFTAYWRPRKAKNPKAMPYLFDESFRNGFPSFEASWGGARNDHNHVVGSTPILNTLYLDVSVATQKADRRFWGRYTGQHVLDDPCWYYPYIRMAPFPGF